MVRASTRQGERSVAVYPVIPVYRPPLSGNERRYVLECLSSGCISSSGVFLDRFERALATAVGASDAIAVSNGTAALYLALQWLGLGAGDEVIVPGLTRTAPIHAIVQTGAAPVFADSRAPDWLLDPEDVARRITPRTRAILPVHLFGAACDMGALRGLAEAHNLAIIEDCAEAVGATLHGRHLGTFGEVGVFSFSGNKTVTTGEGGALVTNDTAFAARMRKAKSQGHSPAGHHWSEAIGLDYRMTNIAAAIGTAQIEHLPAILARKRGIAARYRSLLAESPVVFQRTGADVAGSEWLVSVLLPLGTDRTRVMADMAARGVETTPVARPAHHTSAYAGGPRLPVAEDISARGLSLPSYPTLTEREQARVADVLAAALQ